MAGWVDRGSYGITKTLNTISGPIKKLIRLGQDYEDLIVAQKIGVGVHEASMRKSANNASDEESIYLASGYDVNYSRNKLIGFFQKDYLAQRETLNRMAGHREISKFLEIITDEAIVYDDRNFFAGPDIEPLQDLAEDIREEVKEALIDNFNFIYTNVFDFKESTVGWRFFKQFLIDGLLAFELVYNKANNRIIKAIPLDPAYLVPSYSMVDGKVTRIWVLYPNDEQLRRELPDTHVVYISHAKSMTSSEISYSQTLIRSFNIYRTIENTSIIWTIMNSSYRMKTIVPVAGGRAKNEEQIGQIIAKFREEIIVDDDSGEVFVDGRPSLNLFRNYALASKNGQSTTIETMKFEGYDMSNSDTLKYWRDKLWEDSQIPFVRLQRDSSAVYGENVEGFQRDELRFGKFINRLRSDFQEILSKALWLQMCLDYPMLAEDEYFKSKISIKFNSENRFEELRQRIKLKSSLEDVQALLQLQQPEDSYLDFELVLETYGEFSPEFLAKNKEIKKAKEKEKEKEGNTEEGADEGSDGVGDDFLNSDFGGDDGGGGGSPPAPPADSGGGFDGGADNIPPPDQEPPAAAEPPSE
jgi:hypothetical protein